MKLTNNNVDNASDLVQSTVLRALEKQGSFREGSNLRAWLFTLMYNIFINDFRSLKRRGGETVDIELLENVLGSKSNTLESVAYNELLALLDTHILEEQSQVIKLNMQGLNYEEIAQILNIPDGTVRSRLHRGRINLRKVSGYGLSEE